MIKGKKIITTKTRNYKSTKRKIFSFFVFPSFRAFVVKFHSFFLLLMRKHTEFSHAEKN